MTRCNTRPAAAVSLPADHRLARGTNRVGGIRIGLPCRAARANLQSLSHRPNRSVSNDWPPVSNLIELPAVEPSLIGGMADTRHCRSIPIMSLRSNRRQFLQGAAAASVGFWVAGRKTWADEIKDSKSPNEKLSVASIGVGGKGESDCTQAAKY